MHDTTTISEALAATFPTGSRLLPTCGFILPDGRLVDLAIPSRLRGCSGFCGDRLSHGVALGMAMSEAHAESGVGQALAEGIIRLAPEGWLLQLVAQPTDAQWQTIEHVSRELQGLVLQVGVWGKEQISNMRGRDPQEVVAKLRSML